MQTKSNADRVFVVFDGIDGGGKTTQVGHLRDYLNAKALKFPDYTTCTGTLIQRYLNGWRPTPDELDSAVVLQALMVVNRYETSSVMADVLSKSSLVVDRYNGSGIAYGTADGLDRAWLDAIHVRLPQPDLYVLLDLPVEESFLRRPVRDCDYEDNRGRLAVARDVYQQMWASPARQQSWRGTDVQWLVVDATLQQHEVAAVVRTAVHNIQRQLVFRG